MLIKYILFIFVIALNTVINAPVTPVYSFDNASTSSVFEVPKLTNPVMDMGKILDVRSRHSIEELIRRSFSRFSVQMQVLIIPTLQDEPIEQLSIRVVNEWKLGGVKTDQGLLLLVALQEHKIRLEIGRGLEGVIPDAYARRIVNFQIKPLFKKGLYAQGLYAGLSKAVELIENEKSGSSKKVDLESITLNPELSSAFQHSPYQAKNETSELSESEKRDRSNKSNLISVLALIFIFLVLSKLGGGGGGNGATMLWILSGLMRGGGGGGLGGRSNQDWSGRGGGFGGGGASGDW